MRHIRVYFFCQGRELVDFPFNGAPLVGFGLPSGRIGKAVCFSSVFVADGANDIEISEFNFDGPVSVKVWEPESPPLWFGIASVRSVERIEAARQKKGLNAA